MAHTFIASFFPLPGAYQNNVNAVEKTPSVFLFMEIEKHRMILKF
jgi:hypothetical protein